MRVYELIDTVDNDCHDCDWSREHLQLDADSRNLQEGWTRFVVKPQGFSERNYREMTEEQIQSVAARRRMEFAEVRREEWKTAAENFWRSQREDDAR